jgi:hypothetical protein
MFARGDPKIGIDAIRSKVWQPTNRTDFSSSSPRRMSVLVSRFKPYYTRFEPLHGHPIDLFMGGYWISNLKRLASASGQSPFLPQFTISPTSPTALKPFSIWRAFIYAQAPKMERSWGEVNATISRLPSRAGARMKIFSPLLLANLAVLSTASWRLARSLTLHPLEEME